MSRRLLFLPVLIAGLAMPAASALAGEDSGDPAVHIVRNCVSHNNAKVAVSGDEIDSVKFFVGTRLVKRVTEANSNDRFVLTMPCTSMSVGAHKARAVINRSGDTSTLRFTLTRVARTSPRFTG